MRSQGWSGAAMLPYSELEYGGVRDTVSARVSLMSIPSDQRNSAPRPRRLLHRGRRRCLFAEQNL